MNFAFRVRLGLHHSAGVSTCEPTDIHPQQTRQSVVVPLVLALGTLLLAGTRGQSQPPAPTGTPAQAKADEPRCEFAMNCKPWKEVFAWLNEKTGLPVVGVAIPTGTFTLLGHSAKKYTVEEVIDLINAGLR